MGFKLRLGGKRAAASEPVEVIDATGYEHEHHHPTGAEAENDLVNFKKSHRWDPFLDIEKIDNVDAALASGDPEKEAAIDESLILENSPYPEVRSSVPATDDDTLEINTIRAWTLGLFMCTIIAAVNVLLDMRRTPTSIGSTVVQLIAYPLGKAWERFVPDWTFHVFGLRVALNPCKFNVKEHTIITIMTAAGSAVSYCVDILLSQEVFYHQFFGWGFKFLLVISTQALGFGLAGVSRRFLVWPAAMVWPATLITTTVMHALHNHGKPDPAATNGWRIGRYQFFLVVACCTFVWEWIPQVFAQFLQIFTFVCWIRPNSVVINQVFGGQTGLGILPISFDWGTISGFLLSPLQTPAFAIANVGGGIIFMMIGIIGLAWGGPDFYKYLPLSANSNFDRFGQVYNTSLIINADITFNETAYKAYSPILLGPAFSLSYGLGFATLTSMLTHVALFYGPDIWRRARTSRNEEPDIHIKLMSKYKEAPEWWFLGTFAISFIFGMTASQVWPTHLPWWAFIVAMLIAAFFMVPIGMIQAITNQQPGLNIISEMIFGYMLPGRPVAMMLFKSWAYITCAQGLNYVSDMKVGHYMKIPPRTMFLAQSFAVFWLSIVQTCVYTFLRGNIKNICEPDQAQGLTCANARTFYNASVIWGVIGPRVVFGAGGIYSWVNYFWLIGVGTTVLHFFLARRFPRSFLRYVFLPALFGGAGLIPPATTWYLGQWVIIGLTFNYLIRKRYPGWWSQYNYTLSGALDIGYAFCVVLVALGLGLSEKNFPDWWGNTVPFSNLDANGLAVTRQVPEGGHIGPDTW